MKVLVELEYSCDGYETDEEMLAALPEILEEMNGTAITVRVNKVWK